MSTFAPHLNPAFMPSVDAEVAKAIYDVETAGLNEAFNRILQFLFSAGGDRIFLD